MLHATCLGDLVWADKECEEVFRGIADVVVCTLI